MSNKEIVELYATGDWVLLTPSGITSEWMIVESPRWDCDNYKLVHKKHKHILDAYLDGCRIYWKDLVQNTYGIDKNFIEDYKDTWADGLWDYEAIPKSLENCYCEANELHFCKLIDNGYSFYNNLKAARELDKEEFIKIEEHKKVYYINSNSLSEKKIQFNEQLNNWTYCPYEEKDIEIPGISGEVLIQKYFYDRDTFNERGFETPHFEGEIIKEIKGLYIGWAKIQEVDGIFIEPMIWNKNGTTKQFDNYNLIPIKVEWYKNRDSLNRAFYDIVTKNIVIINWLDLKGNVRILGDVYTYRYERFRPATKQEVDSLYYNKE